ncbi:MAG TPA: hypothetical protein VMU75_04475 [Acidimicrobiales bacterium]|nr:hypothetical protein [Acidimicrobiales bacterium]
MRKRINNGLGQGSISRTNVHGARAAGVLAAALAFGGSGFGLAAQASASPGTTPLVSVATTEVPTSGTVDAGTTLTVTFNQDVTVQTPYSLQLTDGAAAGTLSSSAHDLSASASGATVTFTVTGAPVMSTGASLSLTGLEILAASGVTAQAGGGAWNLVASGEVAKLDPSTPATCSPVNDRVFGGTNCSIGFGNPGPTTPDQYDIIAVPTADLPGLPMDNAPEVITDCQSSSTDTVYDLSTGAPLGTGACGTYPAGESAIGNTTSNTLDYISTPTLTSFEQVGVVEQLPGSLYVSATALPPQLTSITISGTEATFNYNAPVSCQAPGAYDTAASFTYSAPWWSTQRTSLNYPSSVTCPPGGSGTAIVVTYPSAIPTDGVRFKYEGYGAGYFVVGAPGTPLAGEREASESAYVGPAALPANPTIASFGEDATSPALTPAGGSVTLDYAIADATRCSLSATPSSGVTISLPYRDSTATTGPYADTVPASSVPCPDSAGTAAVTLPANTSTDGTAATYTLTFTAASVAGTSPATRTLSLVVPAPPVTISPSITASPASLGDNGGVVHLRAEAAGATSCTVSSVGLRFNEQVSCTNGSTSAFVPRNATSSAETYTFVLTAEGPAGSSAAASTTVTVAARPAHAPHDPWSWLLAHLGRHGRGWSGGWGW